MQLIHTRRGLLAALAVAAAGRSAATAAPFVQAHLAAMAGVAVTSTILLGERSALLVDGQYTLPEAQAVAALIAESGRQLAVVLVTHAHPDHHIGLAAIQDRFPAARFLAHPAIAADLSRDAPEQLARQRRRDPALFPDRLVPVQPLREDGVLLEGTRIEVLGPMRGDMAAITPVWVPSLRALIASDTVFAGTHLWLRETPVPALAEEWERSLERLEALRPALLVPGHAARVPAEAEAAFAHTRTYLRHWSAALQTTRGDAGALAAAMRERVGDLPLGVFLDAGARAARPA
jgi:glyoxylase-like metal-dependent hydrolase (beta-lactamase superfamily II)